MRTPRFVSRPIVVRPPNRRYTRAIGFQEPDRGAKNWTIAQLLPAILCFFSTQRAIGDPGRNLSTTNVTQITLTARRRAGNLARVTRCPEAGRHVRHSFTLIKTPVQQHSSSASPAIGGRLRPTPRCRRAPGADRRIHLCDRAVLRLLPGRAGPHRLDLGTPSGLDKGGRPAFRRPHCG